MLRRWNGFWADDEPKIWKAALAYFLIAAFWIVVVFGGLMLLFFVVTNFDTLVEIFFGY